MTKGKQKLERLASPAGIAVWPRLSGEPDKTFDKEGVYRVQLALDMNEKKAQEFLTALEQRHTAAVAAAKKENPKYAKSIKPATPPWKEEIGEDEKPTGRILVNFKMKASGSREDGSTWERRPALFDAKKKELDQETLKIGGGSTIKVSFEVYPYFRATDKTAGISLRLQGAQILDLVAPGGRDADSLGFGEEEGYAFEGGSDSDGDAGDGDEAEGDY